MKLSLHPTARQSGPGRFATRTAAGEKLLVNRFGISEEGLVVTRLNIEYVAHVLEAAPGS